MAGPIIHHCGTEKVGAICPSCGPFKCFWCDWPFLRDDGTCPMCIPRKGLKEKR